jgi:sigma-B regulation protein RsbU (phosphoserine phosphatase)
VKTDSSITIQPMSKATPKLLLIQKDSTCAQMLAATAFERVSAETLAAGLEKINAHAHDLILLDLGLADGGGLNAFSQVHAAAPQTPVMVLAGAAEEEIAARTLTLGAQDYLLTSQLTAQSLGTAIRKTLDRYYCQLTHNYQGFLLQSLMNSIPDAVYFKDTRSRFLMISHALAKKHHLTDPQQAVGKTDADYFTAPHAKQALADEQTIMRTGQPVEGIEESETWPDGSITWASTTKMPLRNQSGRIVGTFGISRDITARKNAQILLAEKTELLHKKNQQIEEELRMARELQLAMLPQDFPAICAGAEGSEALKFYSYFMPSGAVSGDFFHVLPLSDTAVGIFICDVMGHDVRAALVTAMIHALVEDLSCTTQDPGQLLSEMNLALLKVFRQAGTTMFATALYLVADVATGRVSYSSAAHPHPLRLKRPAGTVEVLGNDAGNKKGPGLGLFRDASYPTCHRPMCAQDLLLFYTDGLTEEEGPDGEIFSQERLAETVANLSSLPPKELLAKVLGEVRRFSGQEMFSDDVCLLGMEVVRLVDSAK